VYLYTAHLNRKSQGAESQQNKNVFRIRLNSLRCTYFWRYEHCHVAQECIQRQRREVEASVSSSLGCCIGMSELMVTIRSRNEAADTADCSDDGWTSGDAWRSRYIPTVRSIFCQCPPTVLSPTQRQRCVRGKWQLRSAAHRSQTACDRNAD